VYIYISIHEDNKKWTGCWREGRIAKHNFMTKKCCQQDRVQGTILFLDRCRKIEFDIAASVPDETPVKADFISNAILEMTPARDPKQFFSTNLENHGRDIREEEPWRRNHGASTLGCIWEAFGKHLGSIWEASGTHLGGI